jgi:hypothetical protein
MIIGGVYSLLGWIMIVGVPSRKHYPPENPSDSEH